MSSLCHLLADPPSPQVMTSFMNSPLWTWVWHKSDVIWNRITADLMNISLIPFSLLQVPHIMGNTWMSMMMMMTVMMTLMMNFGYSHNDACRNYVFCNLWSSRRCDSHHRAPDPVDPVLGGEPTKRWPDQSSSAQIVNEQWWECGDGSNISIFWSKPVCHRLHVPFVSQGLQDPRVVVAKWDTCDLSRNRDVSDSQMMLARGSWLERGSPAWNSQGRCSRPRRWCSCHGRRRSPRRRRRLTSPDDYKDNYGVVMITTLCRWYWSHLHFVEVLLESNRPRPWHCCADPGNGNNEEKW